MRRVAPIMLLIGLVSSCATKPDRLVVAYGNLVRQYKEGRLGVARYEVASLQRGTLESSAVEVIYQSRTQTNAAPKRAILVLSQPLLRDTWRAVGQDFRRGILPDTPDNRKIVAATSDALLLDHPKHLWLPKHRAEEVIRDYLASEGCDLKRLQMQLRRSQFGTLPSGY